MSGMCLRSCRRHSTDFRNESIAVSPYIGSRIDSTTIIMLKGGHTRNLARSLYLEDSRLLPAGGLARTAQLINSPNILVSGQRDNHLAADMQQ